MRWKKIASLVGAVAVITLASGGIFAQTGDGFDLSWHVMGGGGAGAPLTGSGFSVRSTLGQTTISSSSDTTLEIRHGYWPGAINTNPILSDLPDVIIDDMTVTPVSIDLWDYAVDKETSDSRLTYTIGGSPLHEAGVSIVDNRWLTIDPSPSWCSNTDITIRVTDPGELWDSDSLHLSVIRPCRFFLPVVANY